MSNEMNSCIRIGCGMLAASIAMLPVFRLQAEEKRWTGSENNVWDAVTPNWTDLAGNKTALGASDVALFDSTGTRTSVSLSGSQTAQKVVFDGSKDYTLSSSTETQSTAVNVGLTGPVTVEKRGSGTLTVNGMHGFSGDLLIYEGTYAVGTGTTDKGAARNGPLGDPRSERHIVVYTNGTLQLARTGVFGAGTAGSDVLADLEVRGGTLKIADNSCTGIGSLYLHDATLSYNGGAGNWPLLCMTGSYLEFSKSDTTPYELPANGNNCGLFLSRTRPIDIRVPDITGDDGADVVLGLPFKDVIYDSGNTTGWCADGVWNCTTNFVKTGSGRLSIANTDNNIVRDIVVSNGVLSVDAGKARIGADCKVSALGNTYNAVRTLTVEKDAELHLNKSDVFGQYFHNSKLKVIVRGGKLKQASTCGNRFGPLVLEDPSLECALGAWFASGVRWPSMGFSEVAFGGSSPISLNSLDNSAYIAIAKHVLAEGDVTAGLGELDVAAIVSHGSSTEAPDVVIDVPIKDVTTSWSTYNVGKVLPSGFKKTGAGILHLKNTGSNFTGDLEIRGGAVTMGKVGTVEEPQNTPLGNLMAERCIRVADGGELYFTESDQLGQLGADYRSSMAVSNGTIRLKSGTVNGMPALDLYDANIAYEKGNSGTWGLIGFRYKVSFDGTRKLSLPAVQNGIISLGYSSDTREEAGSPTIIHGKTEFCVKDMTADAGVDVDVGLDIQSLPFFNRTSSKHYNERFRCGLLKTGSGTLRLSGTFKCPEETRINEGALLFDGSLAEQEAGWGKSVMRVQDGAYLGGSGRVENVVIEQGGGFTSALGQTAPLTCANVSVAKGQVVTLNVVSDHELERGERIVAPIIRADSGLEGVSYRLLYNGSAVPKEYSSEVVVRNGTVYGSVGYPKGLILIFR